MRPCSHAMLHCGSGQRRQGKGSLMSKQASTLLAWSLCGLTIFLILCASTLAVLNRYNFGAASFLVAEASAAAVGGLISARQPRNPVVWRILRHALGLTLGGLGREDAL